MDSFLGQSPPMQQSGGPPSTYNYFQQSAGNDPFAQMGQSTDPFKHPASVSSQSFPEQPATGSAQIAVTGTGN